MSFAHTLQYVVSRSFSRTARPADHFRTHLGVHYRHSIPTPHDIHIEDIAHHLSLLCRYAGATHDIYYDPLLYSVAEHCVRASYINEGSNALWKLLHDGSEAYCVDLPSPLKYAPFMFIYRYYERKAMRAICQRFCLPEKEPAEVKDADNRMLATEQRDLFGVINDRYVPLPEVIVPWSAAEAKRRYLMRFSELTGQREFYKGLTHDTVRY